MIDINDLRRMAQAATPGPWIGAWPSFGESLPKYLNEVAVDREGDEDDGYSICNAPIGLEEQCSDDMAFIGAANPAAVIELLDRLESAEKERDALRTKIAEMGRQEPVMWANSSDINSSRINKERGGRGDCHTCSETQTAYHDTPLYALPGAAPEPSESEARMRWLLRQIVHALPSRRDWLDPAIEREARIATTPEANHDPR